jgi:hypothetical protein
MPTAFTHNATLRREYRNLCQQIDRHSTLYEIPKSRKIESQNILS